MNLEDATPDDLTAASEAASKSRNWELALGVAGAVAIGASGASLWWSLAPGLLLCAAAGHHWRVGLIRREATRRVEELHRLLSIPLERSGRS